MSFSQKIPWPAVTIATAPHHGSASNATAYERFVNEARNLQITWIVTSHFHVRKLADFLIKPNGQRVYRIFYTSRQRVHPEFAPLGHSWGATRREGVIHK